MLLLSFFLSAKPYTSLFTCARAREKLCSFLHFRESMKLSCKSNCCVFHLYKVFRWYGLTISTPFGLYSEP